MKTNSLKTMALVFLAALLLALTFGFAHGQQQEGTAPSGTVIETTSSTETFTVQSVNPAKNEITLKSQDGKVETYKLGKGASNLSQIKPGDEVKATVVDSMAVSVRDANEPPGAGEGETVILAPKGVEPNVIAVNTEEVSAVIEDVNPEKRTITFMGPQGKLRTVKVGKNVDLSMLKKGDEVVITCTEAAAISVEKPQATQ